MAVRIRGPSSETEVAPVCPVPAGTWSRLAGEGGSSGGEYVDDKLGKDRDRRTSVSPWTWAVEVCARMIIRRRRRKTTPLPVASRRRCNRSRCAGVTWPVIGAAMALSLVFVAASTVLALEAFGRLRFHGFFVDYGESNGLLGFYHEMDADMRALVEAAPRSDARLFPVNAVDQREVKAWVAERRRRTNGRKYLVGCGGSSRRSPSAARLFDTLRADAEWQDLVTRDPTDYFYKEDPKKAPTVLFFCVNRLEDKDGDVMDLFLQHNRYFHELRALGAMVVVWIDDPRDLNQLDPMVIREKILKRADLVVSPYAYTLDNYLASVSAPMNPRDLPMLMWSPHAALSDAAKAPLNTFPIDKLLLSPELGGDSCPLWHWLSEYQSSNPSLLDASRLSIGTSMDTELYASYVRSYRASITTTRHFQYLMPELFEIAATGALLVVNRDVSPLLASLGLIEMQHYVGYDRANPAPTIEWVADPANVDAVDKTRKAGMQFVREHHMVANRGAALDLFVSDGVSAYGYDPAWQLPIPCPSAGAESDAACHARYTRDGVHQCDVWFCGFRSALPDKWRTWWWPW